MGSVYIRPPIFVKIVIQKAHVERANTEAIEAVGDKLLSHVKVINNQTKEPTSK